MSYSIYLIYNGKYRADVNHLGKRKTKVFDKKSDATRWVKETLCDLQLNHDTQQSLSPPTFLSFADAFNLYARDISSLKKTGKKEQQVIARLLRDLPNVDWPIDKYRGEFIEQWQKSAMQRDVKPLKPNSVLRIYSVLSAFFNWCIKKKWLSNNPIKDVNRPVEGEHRERRIELHEAEAILKELDYVVGDVPISKNQQVGLIFMIAIATGMRSGEIVNRLVSEVDLVKRVVIIPMTKIGTKRIVPLDNFALFLWQLALQRERGQSQRVFSIKDGSRDTLFRKARDKAGIVGLTFHDTRHESASLMAKRLANPLTLCKVFGWKNVNRALTYYNPTSEEIADELNQSQGLDVLFKSA